MRYYWQPDTLAGIPFHLVDELGNISISYAYYYRGWCTPHRSYKHGRTYAKLATPLFVLLKGADV